MVAAKPIFIVVIVAGVVTVAGVLAGAVGLEKITNYCKVSLCTQDSSGVRQ